MLYEKSKKILSMMLCSVVIVGAGNLTLVKAHAQTTNKDSVSNKQINTRSTSDSIEVIAKNTTNNKDLWTIGISMRLRNKAFPCYKTWWDMDLICKNDVRLILEGYTNISKDYTFDDEYIWGYEKDGKQDLK